MQTRVAAIVVCFVLLITACTKQPEPAPTSDYIHAPSTTEFRTIAKFSTLGGLWSEAGGASAIKNIYTDSEAHQALLELKSKDNKALWLDFAKGRQLEELDFGSPISGADIDNDRVIVVESHEDNADQIYDIELPDSSPGRRDFLNIAEDGSIRDVVMHPLAKQWWYKVVTAEAMGEGQQYRCNLLLVDDTTQDWPTVITAENITPDCQMVCLADGSLMIESGGFIYIANDTDSQPRKVFAIPSGRQAKIFADTSVFGIAWVYLTPHGSGGGTGRSVNQSRPGKLICIDLAGQEQASIETGSVPFGDVVGDWANLRCLLLQDSVGIALADFKTNEWSWPLRVRDDIRLFLLPNAGEVWALLPDAIVGIGLDELVTLGSKLAAENVIEGDLIEELRPAVEAIGWKWSEVQVSPLMSQTGKLTLFDTSDPDSTWSQLDWSTSKHRATGLLIARVPTTGDRATLQMTKIGIEGWCRENLWALGWQQATIMDSELGKSERHLTYALIPNAKPPLTSGEFQVWITETAAFYSLEGATFEFPSDSLDIGEARQITVDAFAASARIDPEKLLVSIVPKAGWLAKENSGWRFLPDAQEGTTPCFRLEALQDGEPSGLFVIYLDAMNGEVLHQVEDRFSPLANLGVIGGKYSKIEVE